MKMMLAACAAFLIAGCATKPFDYAPPVDLQGKSYDSLRSDLAQCQVLAQKYYEDQYAKSTTFAPGGAVVRQSVQEHAVQMCLTARGYRVLSV